MTVIYRPSRVKLDAHVSVRLVAAALPQIGLPEHGELCNHSVDRGGWERVPPQHKEL
jgi:hypothetical protein